MNSKVKLDIVIHASGLPFNGNTIKERSLGGSESAAYYQAHELARRGHMVTMWTSEQRGGVVDGVSYQWHGNLTEACPLGEQFTFYACHTPHDVLIIQRHPMGFHKDYAAKINVWQLHDVALHRQAAMVNGGLARVDIITGVSQWHVDQVKEIYGLGDDVIRVVPNGVDPELYHGEIGGLQAIDTLRAEGHFICLYQSRPERGLEHLLRPGGIMSQLAESGSKAYLLVCGYDHVAPQMKAYYDQLAGWGQALPNVMNLGCLPKADLARLQRSCDLLLYPTEFAEVSCITAMEAMHAGLPMLTSSYAALVETCKDSGTVMIKLKGDGSRTPTELDNLIGGLSSLEVDEQAFARQVRGLENNPARLRQLRDKQLAAAATRTWSVAVDRLEECIDEAFARRRRPAAQLRHLIEHSDIVMAHKFIEQELPVLDAISHKASDELASMYAFIRPDSDPAAVMRHYEYWEGLNCDRLAEHGDPVSEIESFTRTTRFRGVLQFVAQAIRNAKERVALEHAQAVALYRQAETEANDSEGSAAIAFSRMEEPELRQVQVMEYGCAHGHLLLPLAKMFPDVQFIGVDFMARSVKMAFETARAIRLDNVSFTRRDQAGLTDDLGKFDCIIAAEVLEHVWDYEALLEGLAARLHDGGAIVTTTPCGRWEWSGRDNWRKGRQHVHHFEIADLIDIFGPWGFNRDKDTLYAPAEGTDGTGYQMGSWVCTVSPGDDEELGVKHRPLGKIDLTRKFNYLGARQTVALCMIVKDGEATLRKSMLHVLPYVDEVVIGIDRNTIDDTRSVIRKLDDEFPQVPFTVIDIGPATETGFAAARNDTIAKSVADWILWQDADEELTSAQNLQRLLRPSAFNAFATPQIHYSTNPPAVLTTDFPCRLFRNDRGIQFYGLVHEHPEERVGHAIAHCTLIGDLQFLHAGYTDEGIRRARFQRNLPLLMRDLEENPDRYINKFLLLRDIAQGIGFEATQIGGITPEMRGRARQGVDTFKALLVLKKPILRMLVDALPYYSICVEALGTPGSFDGKINLGFARTGTPTMAASFDTQGRFEDRDTYFKFIKLIAEESTKSYESKYA